MGQISGQGQAEPGARQGQSPAAPHPPLEDRLPFGLLDRCSAIPHREHRSPGGVPDLEAHRRSLGAVAEGVLQQIGDDLGHRAAVATPGGQGAGPPPGTALQGGGGRRPLDQRRERLGEGLPPRTAEQGWQQQGLGIGRRSDQGIGAGQVTDRVHVALQLPLLGEQPLHQGAVVAVLLQAAQQQVAEGAQGGERIAELVHQQAQLLLLEREAMAQALPLPIQPQGLGQSQSHRLEPLAQRLGPGAD